MRIISIVLATGSVIAAVAAQAGQAKNDLASEAAGGKMCPMIYQPVCAQAGSSKKTFPNRCQAESAGYAVVAQGPCGEGSRRILRFGMPIGDATATADEPS